MIGMVVSERESFIEPQNDDETNSSKLLREERQRTGKYIAAGTAIFLTLLGLYQAVMKGTPEYAALFLPAVIMFVYVLWILYTTKKYNSKVHYTNEVALEEDELKEVIANNNDGNVDNNKKPNNLEKNVNDSNIHSNSTNNNKNNSFQASNKNFCRSYSVA